MPTNLMFDGPEDARVTIMLSHGAGAPMDSASMNATTKVLAGAGFRVVRFEFGYMAARRSGERKPPPKAEKVTVTVDTRQVNTEELRWEIRQSGPIAPRLTVGGSQANVLAGLEAA